MLDKDVKMLALHLREVELASGTLDKKRIINNFSKEEYEDFIEAVKCLTRQYIFGYSYENYFPGTNYTNNIDKSEWRIKDLIKYMLEPITTHNLTQNNIEKHCKETAKYADLLLILIDRTIKIGIGKSLFEKDNLSPMLAKKFEGVLEYDVAGYSITEKLDGNRCIAKYNNDKQKWEFWSRNGKQMTVEFDMGNLPIEFVYDGEVLSWEQSRLSMAITDEFLLNIKANKQDVSFNETSGLINRKEVSKNLVYNIFDIVNTDEVYYKRRDILDGLSYDVFTHCKAVRILPVLRNYIHNTITLEKLSQIRDRIVELGGEGIMINYNGALYEHKRTDKLLKYKQVQTMDMRVIAVNEGTGKYEYMVGSLYCECERADGSIVTCNVGSGLSDTQRDIWSEQNNIVGKIVEIAYFSLSQSKEQKSTNYYSLRFPRLVRVREDKNITSEY